MKCCYRKTSTTTAIEESIFEPNLVKIKFKYSQSIGMNFILVFYLQISILLIPVMITEKLGPILLLENEKTKIEEENFNKTNNNNNNNNNNRTDSYSFHYHSKYKTFSSENKLPFNTHNKINHNLSQNVNSSSISINNNVNNYYKNNIRPPEKRADNKFNKYENNLKQNKQENYGANNFKSFALHISNKSNILIKTVSNYSGNNFINDGKITNNLILRSNKTLPNIKEREHLTFSNDDKYIYHNKTNHFLLSKFLRTKKFPMKNKTFSMLLVNNFKVNEVFENEQKSNFLQNKGKNIQINSGKIVLLGLFELTTKYGVRPEGLSELGAAKMAVEHINQKGLLPGYTLELLTNDTQCDPGVGIDRFFHALYTQHTTRMVMLLGSACSEVTESLAKVVPYWNIVQVSFGSTSPALSDRHEFPFFYRTVAPDSSHNPARIAFIKKFGWDTVTTFSQNEEVHSLAVNDLVTELESSNISCAATITFAEADFKEQLLLLRDLDTRIIIGSFSQDLAPRIFCEAFKLGMFGADYAWILHETMGPPWWDNEPNDCFQQQLRKAVENLIMVSSHNSIVGNDIGLSGLNNEMFVDQLGKLNVPQPMSRYAPQTYDAVWAIALALRGAEQRWKNESKQAKLDGFDYTRYDMALEFLQQLGKLNFLGVSGPVSFSGPDRIGTTAFYQIQSGILEPVALYYPAEQNLDFHCPSCKTIKWHSGQVPIAKRIFKLKVATIAPLAFYTIAILSSIGIALAIAFLAFNLHFRKLKAIKLSSPKLSNITAVGCILVYAAVILLGLDYSTLPSAEASFPTVCTARVYLLSAGFSLAFGSMFAKTYRVHKIFTRTGSGVCSKEKMLQDTQLISLVCALLLLDGLVVTLWVVTDPIERHLNNLTLEISATDRSVVYQPQVEVCQSQHTQSWLGALYVYKGLLLIVGVYMAWETRHVKIPALNDSQYIGVSVYSVVITSAIVVVLANLISERVTLAFITITALILASTTATLCLLFLPKLKDIWGGGDVIDPVIRSMGLKMECNTRRFVTDDKRELQYRVEVQNRVYKKEIAALDAEIRRLEKILDGSSSTSSSNTSILGPQKPEVSIIAETIPIPTPPTKSRAPSISGGLPYLLLSVLPPVIPRASWPSAEYMQVPMRRSVTFASQPQLEDTQLPNDVCLPTADLLNLRLVHQQATETGKFGFMSKIRGIFRTSSNKGSINSLSGEMGIKAALKTHMGFFTKLIPSAETASCNTLYNTSNNGQPLKLIQKSQLVSSGCEINQLESGLRETSFFASSSSGHGGSVFAIASTSKDYGKLKSTSMDIEKYIKVSETKVNFQLPLNRRSSIFNNNSNSQQQQQQQQLTLRERIKGSPRFPHRIMPTCSLSALEEKREIRNNFERENMKPGEKLTSTAWKSMEVTATDTISSFSLEGRPAEKPLCVLNNDSDHKNQPTTSEVEVTCDKPISISPEKSS